MLCPFIKNQTTPPTMDKQQYETVLICVMGIHAHIAETESHNLYTNYKIIETRCVEWIRWDAVVTGHTVFDAFVRRIIVTHANGDKN